MSFKTELKKIGWEPLIFFKWVLFALLIGVVVGGVSVAFYYGFTFVTSLRTENSWLIYLLPVGGLVIVLLYKFCGMSADKGTDFVIISVRENAAMPLRTAPLVFVSTLITHLFGGSAGREGAILQIGGSISNFIGRKVRLDEKDSRIITMCGMSAAFAALFGTPLTAAIFAMELVSVGVMYYAAIVPCVLSAITGVYLAQLCGVPATAFSFAALPSVGVVTILQALGMGVLFALLSILFCIMMKYTPKVYGRLLPNPFIRAVVGGALVAAITLLLGTYDYNGSGGSVIAAALAGNARTEAFVLKLLLTAITLGAGFKGGEIIPAFFVGATFGCVTAPLLGLPAYFGAGLGMVSVFCGVTNCPVTSILLAMELFGGVNMPLFALSLAVSYMLSGYYSLYSEQKFVYSKFRPVYIDHKAK